MIPLRSYTFFDRDGYGTLEISEMDGHQGVEIHVHAQDNDDPDQVMCATVVLDKTSWDSLMSLRYGEVRCVEPAPVAQDDTVPF